MKCTRRKGSFFKRQWGVGYLFLYLVVKPAINDILKEKKTTKPSYLRVQGTQCSDLSTTDMIYKINWEQGLVPTNKKTPTELDKLDKFLFLFILLFFLHNEWHEQDQVYLSAQYCTEMVAQKSWTWKRNNKKELSTRSWTTNMTKHMRA